MFSLKKKRKKESLPTFYEGDSEVVLINKRRVFVLDVALKTQLQDYCAHTTAVPSVLSQSFRATPTFVPALSARSYAKSASAAFA